MINQDLILKAERFAQIGAWELDLSTIKWSCSEGFLCIHGVDHGATITGRPWPFILPDDEPAFMQEVVNAIEVKRPFDSAHRIRRPSDAEVRWLHVWGDIECDEAGNPIKLCGVVHDVTRYGRHGEARANGTQQHNEEQTEVEEALRHSEMRYRLLAENVSDVVWVGDTVTKRLTYISPSVEKLLGFRPDEVMQWTPLDIVALESRPRLAQVMAEQHRAYVAGAPTRYAGVELEQRRRDGSNVWTETVTHYVTNPESGHIEIYAVTRDISERRARDVEIRQLNAELERRVMERTAQLSGALEELKRANVLKDSFLAAVSHELRTPLSGILSIADVLELPTSGLLTERQLRYVKHIRESGERLLSLIDSILEYTALIGGRTPFKPEVCSLLELGAAALRAVRSKAEHKDHAIKFLVEPYDTKIVSDPNGILQILTNLLDNAVKFTPAGGTVGLDIVSDPARESVNLIVWDTGIGIASEHREVIFRPFEQADYSLSRQYEGVGLGLAYAQRLTEWLGGSIRVESAVGSGSRFIVTLPREP